MTQFNINEFMKKEMKEFEREHIDYIKVKALYDFKNKRKYYEMIEEKLVAEKKVFQENVIPQWLEEAKERESKMETKSGIIPN